jgi:hypothetical protein
MKRGCPARRAQSGMALIALLVLLIMAGSFALYRSLNSGTDRVQVEQSLIVRLARAKDALLAYAVTDNTRPGRLLCPDLIGDGISPLLSRDDCDAYKGWLPWKTLDLGEGSDDTGSKLYYILSPLFGGDRSTPPLNSDTATSLRLDLPAGSPSNDIVALIIAPRGTLDSRNADGDDYYYSGHSGTADDNDVVVALTRRELMAAVEKRIANELRSCLEGHATSPDNTNHTYPWPAPLSNSIFKGVANSYFGMIPATQPGSNPDQVLKKSISDLSTAKTALESASTAAAQLAAVQQISELASYARALYDRLYIVAADLEAKATVAESTFKSLDDTIVATTSGTLASVPAALQSALPSLAALRESLANSGLDAFLIELQIQNPILSNKISAASTTPSASTFSALKTQDNVFKNKLLEYSTTPNSDLTSRLNSGLVLATTASSDARNAELSPADTGLAAQAIASARALYDANLILYSSVQASRINVDGNEISFRATQISSALAEFTQKLDTDSALALASAIEASRTLVASIATSSSNIVAARTAALAALDQALAAARAASDASLTQSTSSTAVTQLNGLASSLLNNGDNIVLETLKSDTDLLASATQSAPATLTAARALRTPVKEIIYWADASAAQAADIARLARKSTWASGDSDTSAYTAARQLLASLDGETGTASALDAYIKSPSDAAKQTTAQTALATTQSLLADTLTAAGKLEALLETSLADAATPTVWYGSACSILKPPSGSDTWWVTHGWASLFFYQISDRVRAASGKLKVNGTASYRVVVVGAGRSLGTQNRSTRTTASYLEGSNADISRDGNAKTPVTVFSNAPLSDTFNDRLAF